MGKEVSLETLKVLLAPSLSDKRQVQVAEAGPRRAIPAVEGSQTQATQDDAQGASLERYQ